MKVYVEYIKAELKEIDDKYQKLSSNLDRSPLEDELLSKVNKNKEHLTVQRVFDAKTGKILYEI